MEYDFIVSPGTDPSQIQLQFDGATALRLDNGELIIKLATGEFRQHRPVIYQEINGKRKIIKGGYRLIDKDQIAFEIGDYDHNRQLIIDPVITFASLLGGNQLDYFAKVVVDDSGYIYLLGKSQSANISFPKPPNQMPIKQQEFAPKAFIMKLTPGGDEVVYTTYFGNFVFSIRPDREGNIYLTGYTDQADFPVTTNAYQTNFQGQIDAYIAKINTTGDQLLYATYFGGSGYETGKDITVDGTGNAYIVGDTNSNDLTLQAPLPIANRGASDGFIAKIDENGERLLYASIIGGKGEDLLSAIEIDNSGLYLAGTTESKDFPLVNPIQDFYSGLDDVFVMKLVPDGSNIIYSTYLGGSYAEEEISLAVDSKGSAHVSGLTASKLNSSTGVRAYPTKNALNKACKAYSSPFISKLTPEGNDFVYSTLICGDKGAQSADLALDQDDNAYITGYTLSIDLPIKNGLQSNCKCQGDDGDAYILALNPKGKLKFSTYLGGNLDDAAASIAIDNSNSIYIAGSTTSTQFPLQQPIQNSNQGVRDAFIIRLSGTIPLITNIEIVNNRLNVVGLNFDSGAMISIDNQQRAGKLSSLGARDLLISKSVAKKIASGATVKIKVVNSNGKQSQEFSYTRP